MVLQMPDTSRLINARMRRKQRDGIVDVFGVPGSQQDVDFRAIVDLFPIERIKGLREKTKLPVARIVALLGISQPAYSKMCSGDFTPSPNLCRRMQELEDMAARGELHSQHVPTSREMQRRMALFRSWFLSKDPSVDLPLITCHLQVQWGKAAYQKITIPIKYVPQLRLKDWTGLVGVIRAVTVALRKLAQGNARILWRQAEAEFWSAYARDTLPKIVTERAKILPKATAAAKRKGGRCE